MFDYKGYPFLTFYSPEVTFLITAAVIWTLVWKGLALWKAGQSEQKPWFVVLFITNTLGILDIVYLFWFAKKKN